MNVLLLNPPGPYCRAGSRWPHKRKPQRTGIDYHPFPFGLAYAASRLRLDGHTPRILDAIAEGISHDELSAQITNVPPDITIMETSAPSYQADITTLGLFTTRNIPCIAVGAHATATVREHLASGFTAVIRGEYDPIISEAITLAPQPWLADSKHPEATHAPLAVNLDALPYPAWDLMPMERYNDPICQGRSITVLSSRGCPMRCGFCTLSPYHGRANYRLRTPESVCDEIGELIARHHPDEIYFDDDSITMNRGHILGLCQEIRNRNWGLPFCSMGNATVDHDVLKAMAGAGCRAFKFGVESADPAVLARIPKMLNLDDVLRTVRDCNDLGIHTHATFLFGLPGETPASAQRTIDFALALGAHTLQFAIVTPYPGTALYEQAQREGWLVKKDWREFDPAGGAVLSYPGYTPQDIASMHDLAWKRWQKHMLLHRPGTLFHHFSNAYRREGIPGLLRLGRYSLSRLFSVMRTPS